MNAAVQPSVQDKARERAVFSEYARAGDYNVLTPRSRAALLARCVALGGFRPGDLVCDLGCGSGVFTDLLRARGMRAIGVDLCEQLLAVGRVNHAAFVGIAGDVEQLPIRSESVDGVLLSGLIHHLPDASLLAAETYRILKPGGRFAGFDPNRRNPFMWLYRDHDSPFYSSVGVSPNERPVLAEEVVELFRRAGCSAASAFTSVAYGGLASSRLRWALPLYNTLEAALFAPPLIRGRRAFVLTYGRKPCR